MKAAIFALFAAVTPFLAQDITFTNRIVTFTNLQGRVYKSVAALIELQSQRP